MIALLPLLLSPVPLAFGQQVQRFQNERLDALIGTESISNEYYNLRNYRYRNRLGSRNIGREKERGLTRIDRIHPTIPPP